MALVGPSGAGKTTLCSLIPRFYEATEGSIRIDGKDIKDVTLKSLRDNIGVVQQDVYLFMGSIKENIRYGKPDATDDEVIAAAKLANAHEFIEAFENRLESVFLHPKLKRKVSYRTALKLDCYKLIKNILEEKEFVPFSLKEGM